MVIVRTGSVSYSELSQTVNPFSEALQSPSISALWNIETTRELIGIGRKIARQAGTIDYINTLFLYTAACVVGLPLVLLVCTRRG